ncbi:MAG: hypothetical protein KBD63_02610 [Bacteriovoracaceae bacterium]|nr:hypothetical protein [Bacteriovoracaceae bacterium]
MLLLEELFVLIQSYQYEDFYQKAKEYYPVSLKQEVKNSHSLDTVALEQIIDEILSWGEREFFKKVTDYYLQELIAKKLIERGLRFIAKIQKIDEYLDWQIFKLKFFLQKNDRRSFKKEIVDILMSTYQKKITEKEDKILYKEFKKLHFNLSIQERALLNDSALMIDVFLLLRESRTSYLKKDLITTHLLKLILWDKQNPVAFCFLINFFNLLEQPEKARLVYDYALECLGEKSKKDFFKETFKDLLSMTTNSSSKQESLSRENYKKILQILRGSKVEGAELLDQTSPHIQKDKILISTEAEEQKRPSFFRESSNEIYSNFQEKEESSILVESKEDLEKEINIEEIKDHVVMLYTMSLFQQADNFLEKKSLFFSQTDIATYSYLRALIKKEIGDFVTGLELIDHVLQTHLKQNQRASFFLLRGDILLQMGDKASAIKYYQVAGSLDGSLPTHERIDRIEKN